jgi:predicted RNA binding protein YcfA (HicA-like mRNA interferase family)
VRLRHPDRRAFLVVPLHRELKRGTLRGILRDADVTVDQLRDNL